MPDNDPNLADAADYDLVPVDHVPQFGAAAGAAKAAPNLLEQAQAQYPILQGLDYGYVENFRPNAGFLEHWQPGDAGVAPSSPASLDALRPKELPIDKPGLEIRDPTTRPIDILGDIVSHNLVNTDPVVKRAYDKLQASLTPHQQSILQNQYEYAQKNEGETGSFEDWKQRAGMPGFLRGYTFQQWPKEFTDKVYTPQQRADLDKLMEYFRTPASSDDASNFQLVPVDHQPDFGDQQGMATGGAVQDKNKTTKKEAAYRGGNAKKRCGICSMYVPPSSCTAVRGVISPWAVCRFFERKKG